MFPLIYIIFFKKYFCHIDIVHKIYLISGCICVNCEFSAQHRQSTIYNFTKTIYLLVKFSQRYNNLLISTGDIVEFVAN